MAQHALRSLLLIAVALGLRPLSFSQDAVVDSLRQVLRTVTTDSTRVALHRKLARHFGEVLGVQDSAIAEARRGLAVLDGLPDDQGAKLRPLRIKLLEIEGFALHQRSQNDEALIRFQDAARLAEAAGLQGEVAGMYTYMANCFRVTKDGASELKYIRKAIAIQETLGESSDLAVSRYGLAMHYMGEERFDSVEHWAKRALVFFTADRDPPRQVGAETLLIEAFYRTRQHDSAAVHLRALEAIAEGMPVPQLWTMLYGMRGRLALFQGNYAQALTDLDSAKAIADRASTPYDRYMMHRLRGFALLAEHRIDEGFIAMDSAEATIMRDFGLDKTREITESRMRYEQEKEMAIADAELRQQRTMKWAAIAVAALVLAIAFALWHLFRLKARTAEELLRKNDEIQRAQAQLLVTEKQREAEQVRTRIARDIHDDIGASLTKIKLLSDVAAKNTPEQAEDTKRALTRIGEHARTVSQAMSDIVWAVDPKRDTHQGMIDHVRLLAQRLLGDNGIAFTVDLFAADPLRQIEPWLKRDLHLVINEAFNNILKYALAKNVAVKLHMGERFTLRIADDGIGFHTAQVGEGNGLRNMPERMRRHKGSLTISSSPGKGCTVAAEGPAS